MNAMLIGTCLSIIDVSKEGIVVRLGALLATLGVGYEMDETRVGLAMFSFGPELTPVGPGIGAVRCAHEGAGLEMNQRRAGLS